MSRVKVAREFGAFVSAEEERIIAAMNAAGDDCFNVMSAMFECTGPMHLVTVMDWHRAVPLGHFEDAAHAVAETSAALRSAIDQDADEPSSHGMLTSYDATLWTQDDGPARKVSLISKMGLLVRGLERTTLEARLRKAVPSAELLVIAVANWLEWSMAMAWLFEPLPVGLLEVRAEPAKIIVRLDGPALDEYHKWCEAGREYQYLWKGDAMEALPEASRTVLH